MATTKQTKMRSDERLLSEIVCSIDDIANGKKGGRTSRHKVISQFVLSSVSANKKAFDEVIAFLEADRQKPKIKSLFPEISPTISEKLRKWPNAKSGVSNLLQKATLFSDWYKKPEVLSMLDSLGILLEYGMVLREAVTLVNSKTYPSLLITKNKRGFIYLRELAAVFYTAATMKMLPTVTTSGKIALADQKIITSAVKRFSIEEEVLAQHKQLLENIKDILTDLEDFCADYPKSSARIKGLNMLKKYCAQFVSSN